ncbi:MAG: FAD-dependent oxidoreductase, partial [Deltaproteobacteria bacterium]|nr:FAD-dependent oxidoreductase [Deltaproteobacteria bacterium]
MNVVIIGNSAAGLSGLEAFRKHDQTSQMTIIAKEGQRPYSRVLLPYYLRGKVPHEHLFVREQDYYEQLNATCVNGTVIRLLVEQQRVQLADQTMLPYDKLLIATGASPVKPPIPGLSGDGIHHLWTLEDVGKLKRYYKEGNRVVVLGSGFVSLQGACAALSCGLNVSVIELANRIMPRALDEPGADILAFRMKEMGVDLRVNTLTTHIERNTDKKYKLFFKDGGSLTADFIIVGTGVQPNIDFLEDTTIKIDAGIIVNERMETSL